MTTKAIVGKKIGMTQVWDESNRVVPVTVLKVEDIRIVQIKNDASDGYSALQVTTGFIKESKLNSPESGHFKAHGVQPGAKVLELRLDDVSEYEVGQTLGLDKIEKGQKVDVTAISKGKGFAGPMKRHNFKGQGAGHGNHKKHRAPGSIGACATPSRVFKGVRMAGQMGAAKVTTLNLEVVSSDSDKSILLIKGAVPGPKGGFVVVRDAIKAGK